MINTLVIWLLVSLDLMLYELNHVLFYLFLFTADDEEEKSNANCDVKIKDAILEYHVGTRS